jgi:methylase of polypeptide subunit release factors
MKNNFRSKSGLPLIKFGERYLCSSVDPMKEAVAWVEKHKDFLVGLNDVMVLGVGCGYHLLALLTRFAGINIIAIDNTIKHIEFVKREHSIAVSNVEFLCVDSLFEATQNIHVHNMVNKPYAVLKFSPAIITFPQLFYDLEALLLARSEQGLDFVIKCRPDLKNLFIADGVRGVAKSLLSIKDLDARLQKLRNSDENIDYKQIRENYLTIKILRELIS